MSENGNQNGLTDKQQRAITALLSEPTAKSAAKKAKVSETTLYRWLSDALFSAALREARGRVLESTLSALQGASGKAVETLLDVMDDKTAHPSARVSAAKAVLEMMLRGRDALDNEERLRLLELRLMMVTNAQTKA